MLYRFNRKFIVVVGVTLWLAAVIASTFVPAEHFWMFLLFRGIVGIGEASYSNVCPSMISDMFTGPTRSRMYMIFYFAVPVGSGLGFVVGSNVASLLNACNWDTCYDMGAGIVALALLILVVDEPKRGGAEITEGAHLQVAGGNSYWMDIKALACTVGLIFGLITTVSGIIGVSIDVSDAIRGPVKTPETQYLSLIKACAVTVVLLCVSAALYFACAAVLIKDQYKFKEQMGMSVIGAKLAQNFM
ncbi:hypothetical protein OSTOST_04624 [Ostertagia ostertagi]